MISSFSVSLLLTSTLVGSVHNLPWRSKASAHGTRIQSSKNFEQRMHTQGQQGDQQACLRGVTSGLVQNTCCQVLERWIEELQRVYHEAELTLEKFEQRLQEISTEFRYGFTCG